MDFGEQVKYIRTELCLSQAELAKELNVTEQTIRHWEYGLSKPRYSSIRNIKALCIKKKIILPETDKDNA